MTTAIDPATFRASIVIDCDGQEIPFVPDPWQEGDFAALDSGWLKAAGWPVHEGKPTLRGWLERPRGHSKTSDLALMVAWALALARHPVRGVAAAADQDQSKLLRDAISRLCRLNPWLDEILDVQTYRVVNRTNGAELSIISSDVATSWGQLPDFVVCDEVSHWPEGRGEELWQSLLSSAAKRSNCLLIVITNAGFMDSWAWRVREAVRTDPAWAFRSLDGAQASWISPAALAEQERLLPPLAYDRLWRNRWVPGSGDALSADEIEAAVILPGPPRRFEPTPGWTYSAGLDLSLKRDRSAFVIVGRHKDRLQLAHVREWRPPIDLPSVQAHVAEYCRRYRAKVWADVYQAAQMAQQLVAAGIRAETVAFTGNVLHAMATACLQVFRDRRVELWRHESLLADLRRLRIIERPQGFRLDAPRTQSGHVDTATALTLAVYGAERTPWTGPAGVPRAIPLLHMPHIGMPGGSTAGGLPLEAQVARHKCAQAIFRSMKRRK